MDIGTTIARATPFAQGAYYLGTGVWPFLSLRSFQAVTGPKMDTWLVKTVGVLVTTIGASLLVSACRSRPRSETVVLGAGSATALAAIEVHYRRRGRISSIYLADAAAEAVLLAGWVLGPLFAKRASHRRWPHRP